MSTNWVNNKDVVQAAKALCQGKYGTALSLLETKAGDGHPEAQYLVGLMFRFDLGLISDGKKGLKLIEMTADQGHGDAQHQLAKCYREIIFDECEKCPSSYKLEQSAA
jgi:TPR repeat protein